MESFDAVLAGLLCLAVVFILVSRWRNGSRKCKRPPPEAGQAWPLIGHLHLMARSKSPHKMLGAMADKFGPIFTIRLGMQRILIVSSLEIAKECFTTNDVAFSSRPKTVALDHLSYNYAMFGFAPYGTYWRELRKLATLELLSSKRIELLKHVRISETHSFIKELYSAGCVNSLEGPAEPFKLDMKEWFGKLTFNITLQMVAGKRSLERYSDAENDTADITVYRKALSEFFRLTGLFVISDAFPFLRWLDIGGHGKEMKATARELDRIGSQWLDEHKRKNTTDGMKQDFMAVMLSMLEDYSNISQFDQDTIIKSTCFALIAGGSDTSAVTLEWTLGLIINNPQTLRKCQEELDFHVGRSRLLNESDIGNLEYLKAVVKESMRLYPSAPLGVHRQLSEDCAIGGYHVAKGTNLIVNAWKIQRDPDIWSDPSEFQPERFLTDHKHVDVKGLPYELLPFGSGRRVCPGITFAHQVLHLALASFLQAFDVRNASDGLVDMSENYGLTNKKAIPLEVVVTPRLPLQLYE